MKTITIKISESEFRAFSLNSNDFEFSDFLKKIKVKIAQDALNRCHSIAKKEGFNSLSLEEINAEIQEVRNAKNNN